MISHYAGQKFQDVIFVFTILKTFVSHLFQRVSVYVREQCTAEMPSNSSALQARITGDMPVGIYNGGNMLCGCLC